jgi:hypothetical protein
MMSTSELQARAHNTNILRRKRNGWKNPYPHNPKLVREYLPTCNDPELTIRLRESTVNRLKDWTWYDDPKNKGNDRTYNEIILELLNQVKNKDLD